MSVRKLQANSLDVISSHLLQTQKMGTILRAFRQMVTIQTKDGHYLHVVNPTLGNGPRRIVLNPYPDEVFHTFYPGMRVELNSTSLTFENGFICNLMNARLWSMPLVKKMKLIRDDFLVYLKEVFKANHLDLVIQDEHPIIQDKLHRFFHTPSVQSIEAILGLGGGSTPLGDDALCGYILSQRFLGKSPTLIHSFADEKFFQTTQVSQEMLRDVYQGAYSQVFIEWLEKLLNEPRIGIDQAIRQLGGSSGVMIVTSFYHFTIQSLKEDPYEHVFAYSR